MEENTRSSSAMSEKQTLLSCVAVRRLFVLALLISGVVAATLPSPMHAATWMQTTYRVTSISAGSSPSAAKIGDLDGDGRNDIAVVNSQGSLQLFFNRGDGSFDRVSLNGQWPSSSSTLGVDIGDLNRDGRNDLAVAFSTSTGAVSVLLNQGNRVFSPPMNYASCNSSNGVVIGDLDQDGDNDLADVSECAKSSVLLNNGLGGFTFSGSYGTGAHSRSIALGDFNRDGFKDIVYVNNGVNANGSCTVLFNNGHGAFGSPMWLYAGDLPEDVTAGDFNGDGDTDIAIANPYFGQVIMLFNDAQGTFTTGYSEIANVDTPTSIASGDFNGDGRLDFAVTTWTSSSISVYLNQNGYDFTYGGTLFVLQHPVDLQSGKLDGDSLPDLVAVNQSSGTISVFLTAAGAPPPPPPPPPPPAQITLSLSSRTTSKARLVDLRWNGATSSSVDIFRNGSRVATVSNSGGYTDQFGRRATGTFTYKVCVAGSQQCSNQSTIGF